MLEGTWTSSSLGEGWSLQGWAQACGWNWRLAAPMLGLAREHLSASRPYTCERIGPSPEVTPLLLAWQGL